MTHRRIPLGPATLKDGDMKSFKVGKRDVLIARVNGSYKALDDWCNHAGCMLSGGRLEGNTVVCPCHEIGFDLDTGKNVTSPGVCDDQPAFKAEIEGETIVVVGDVPER